METEGCDELCSLRPRQNHIIRLFVSVALLSVIFIFHIWIMLPSYFRHISVLAETIKKGIHDADSEARIEARK